LTVKVGLAVATGDGRLFYELVEELKRRGVRFLVKLPGEPLPLTVKAVLTSEAELSKVEEAAKSGIKVVACRHGEAGRAVSKALLAVYGLENKVFTVGIDPGKTLGFAVVAGGTVVHEGSYGSLKRLFEAFEKVLAEWKPKRVVVKVGGSPKTWPPSLSLLKLKAFLEEASRRLKVEVSLKLVDEAGTTVKAKRRGAKHRGADEASAVEIALRES